MYVNREFGFHIYVIQCIPIYYILIYTEIYSQTVLNNEIKEQTKSNRKYMNCCNSKKLEQKIKCKMNKTRQEECVNKPYINIKRYLTTHTLIHIHIQ